MSSDSVTCFLCKEKGHLAKYCTKNTDTTTTKMHDNTVNNTRENVFETESIHLPPNFKDENQKGILNSNTTKNKRQHDEISSNNS